MKKSTKGALAAGAAAFLLLGGAGTLAYWTDDAQVDGGTVDSGSIDLINVECATDWTYDDDTTTLLTTVTSIVPGDTIVKQCTADLVLVGDHIGATVDISDASLTSLGGLQDELTVAAALTDPAGGSVAGAGTHAVTIDLTVDFPYGTVSVPDPTTGADNDSQIDTATLDAITLVAVQTHE
jgi:alternate signal-mediated exported protein